MNILNRNGCWDRTPKGNRGVVGTSPDHFLIPMAVKQELIRSDVRIEMYGTDEEVKPGMFMLWSPKKGGTIHIEKGLFQRLRFLDRLIAIKLSLSAHRLYKDGNLRIKGGRVLYEGSDMSNAWGDVMIDYTTGNRHDAMDVLANLPWFADKRPSHLNEESQECHIQTLDKIYSSHLGENRGKKYA